MTHPLDDLTHAIEYNVVQLPTRREGSDERVLGAAARSVRVCARVVKELCYMALQTISD